MNTGDRKYLAFLTVWAVDRIATVIYNASGEGSCMEDSSYEDLLEQARVMSKEWDAHIQHLIKISEEENME